MTNQISRRLDELEKKLDTVTEDIFDDGRDSGDQQQNGRFARELRKIEDIGCSLAGMSIPGKTDEELDRLWVSCWNGKNHFPEDKYNHHRRYIKALRTIISDCEEMRD